MFDLLFQLWRKVNLDYSAAWGQKEGKKQSYMPFHFICCFKQAVSNDRRPSIDPATQYIVVGDLDLAKQANRS